MFNIRKRYADVPENESGCDLCQMNIHRYETYYEIIDSYDEELLVTVCELCKPKLLKKFKELEEE